MSSKRFGLVVFALFGALLAVTAMPVGAAQTNTALGNIHTNDTDFNAASTLQSVTVVGSGDEANVELGSFVGFNDTFEGESADPGLPDNWEVSGNGPLESAAVTTSRVHDGAQAATVTDTTANGIIIRPSEQPYSGETSNVSTWMYVSQNGSGTEGNLRLIEGGNTRITVRVKGGNLVNQSGGTISTDVDFDEWVFIEIYDIDPASDTYSVRWIEEGGGASGTATGLSMFSAMTNGYDSTAIVPFNADMWWDSFDVEASEEDTGTYISQTQSVDNAATGFTNLTLSNAEAHVTWLADTDDDGTFETEAATSTYTTSGNKTLDVSGTSSTDWRVNVTFVETGASPTAQLHDEGLLFTNNDPRVDNASATPTGGVSTGTPTLQIDINDTEFLLTQGDSVDVEFFVDGSSIGTDTLTSNGTASQTVSSELTGGDHTWNVTATDSYGLSNTSQDFTISIPSNLTIREEVTDHSLITSCSAEVTFYEDVENDPVILNRTDSDNDGNISLEGLPVSSEFSVGMNCSGYHSRTTIIDSIFDQQTVYLINTSQTTVENRFTVADRTGDFPPDDTEIVVQKAINRSIFDSGADGFEWVNVAGDDVGADGAYTTDLIEDDRYRLRVENDDGDTRILGAYTPQTTGTIELTIGRVVIDPEDADTLSVDIERTNETGSPVQVSFEYNDSEDATETIYLEIFEYNNESNVLLSNTSFDGPFGTFTNTENVPAAENDTTWTVKYTIVRTDETIQGRTVVGPTQEILQDLPPWLITVIFVGMIWTTAGIFSQLNGAVGGLIIAGLGAMFFFIGLVPTELGAGVMLLSLVTAGIIFIRERGGGF